MTPPPAGDLNYRVEHENMAVRKMISEGKHLDLLQYDQLLREIRDRKAFVGFHEAAITFKPTFKFDEETGGSRAPPQSYSQS